MFLALLNVVERDVIFVFPACIHMRKEHGVPPGGGGSSSAAAAKLVEQQSVKKMYVKRCV